MSQFHPNQIVSLDHHCSRLYCEVVQPLEDRELCWVRPLFLAVLEDNSSEINCLYTPKTLVDVRLTSDLLYPIKMFRPALDTEVIAWLDRLEYQDYSAERIQKARQELQQFIKEVWQETKNN